MRIEHDLEKKVTILLLNEDIINDIIDDSMNELVQQSLDEGILKFVIDFSHVQYVKSTGIGTVVRALARVQKARGKMVLCGINDRVTGLLSITKLDTVFEFYPTKEEALNSF